MKKIIFCTFRIRGTLVFLCPYTKREGERGREEERGKWRERKRESERGGEFV